MNPVYSFLIFGQYLKGNSEVIRQGVLENNIVPLALYWISKCFALDRPWPHEILKGLKKTSQDNSHYRRCYAASAVNLFLHVKRFTTTWQSQVDVAGENSSESFDGTRLPLCTFDATSWTWQNVTTGLYVSVCLDEEESTWGRRREICCDPS